MFTSQPIGFVSSPYKDASEVPKGLGAKHEADGVLKILPEFEPGLTDIEGFSHLIVIWEFDRSPKLELRGDALLGTPPSDNRPHGVFATRSPRRPNPIGLTTVERRHRAGTELQVRGLDMLDGTPISANRTCPASRPKGYAEGGWPKLRHDRGDERAKACKAPPAPAPAMLNLPQQAWSGPAFLAIVS
jgi:tRNA (adenine37-N6)-methyltransferase